MIANLCYQGPIEVAPLAAHLASTTLARSASEGRLSPVACRQKAELAVQVVKALKEDLDASARDGLALFFVPGRIEVLGKHTDYAGGSSLVAAAERGFVAAVVPDPGGPVRIRDVAWGQTITFALDPELVPGAGHWSNYPQTVARRLARNFPSARCGARLALASDLPAAAGMSSSSALMVATFLALDHVNQISATETFRHNVATLTDLAGYLGTVENGQTFGTLAGDRGVGTFGGSEDHTAMLCARAGQLSQYAYCPVRFQQALPLPPGYGFAIGVSGVAAEKTGAAMDRYNQASRLVSEIQCRWSAATGRSETLAAAVASSPDAPQRLHALNKGVVNKGVGSLCLPREETPDPFSDPFSDREKTPDPFSLRLEHFLVENQQVIPGAGEALLRGDLAAWGRWVDRSQQAAEELLGNQVPETSRLARSARELGAAAASAFGAGFGGSVWALIETSRGEDFLAAWAERYRREFPNRAAEAHFFLTAAGPAAFRLM